MSEAKVYLGIAELAERANITKNTASAYGRSGYLPEPDVVVRSNGRDIRGWTQETIDYWIAHRNGRKAR